MAVQSHSGVACGPIIDLTGRKLLPIGSELFEEVSRELVYIDKSPLIRDIIDSAKKVILFCRPRRFGKSLAMDTLRCFFEIPVEGYIDDSRSLFEPLAIWNAGEQYRSLQGAFPVIYLSLNTVGGRTWDEAKRGIAAAVALEYNRHFYLHDVDIFKTPGQRARFERLADGVPNEGELEMSLAWLSQLLMDHHKRETVILIDEYDAPVTAGHTNGYREDVVSFTRLWLTGALKSSRSLRFACLTGVQRVSKESIFSGLNNIVVDTALDTRFAEGFGFTDSEVEALLAYMARSEHIDEMRHWYDGYNFGGTAAYNPWSVLNYVGEGCIAQPYWANTSGNSIVHELFGRAGERDLEELRRLADGGTVTRPLDLNTDFAQVEHDASAIWDQLYLAGYVTTDDIETPNSAMVMRELRIPNREVGELFRREFFERSWACAGGSDRLASLGKALAAGDEAGFEFAMRAILMDSPSARDLLSENSYHMFLLGLLDGLQGYRFPLSNRENGEGIPDIVLGPNDDGRRNGLPALVIEVKHERGADEVRLRELAGKALAQIDQKAYAYDLYSGRVLSWGIAFSGKRVAAACVG